MAKQPVNFVGKTFGRLVVTEIAPARSDRNVSLVCKCECGATTVVLASNLTSGKTKSCGCLQRESRKAFGTHKKSKTREYRLWSAMKRRCLNQNTRYYPRYGGRGITICDRWMSFENFIADMGHPPPGRSLDRIDNSSGYSPENCRWSTATEQACNRRNTEYVTLSGYVVPLAEACRAANAPYGTIKSRRNRGWPDNKLFDGYKIDLAYGGK